MQLDEYSEICRSVAWEMGSTICDLRKAFVKYLKTNNPDNKEAGILTYDSVHMNDEGNRLIASEMLKVLE